MASVTGKVRSRKDGAAVPLDDLDRKLLNLMQGQFPLEPRPYAAVAEKAEVTEDEVMARVARLLDDRIIRQVTPIYDTRAFGYGSMLVAAKVDPEHPWRAGEDHQLAPRRLAQLPAQPRVQHVVHDRGRGGLGARPAGHARRPPGADRRGVDPPAADAEAVQDPHGPRDGGRTPKALATRGRGRRARAELEGRRTTSFDVAVVRATQGDMPVVSEPYAPAAAELGWTVPAAARAHGGDEGARPAAPRRRDPLPPPRRLQRERHGRLEGARGPDRRARPAHGRVPRHQPLLPAPDLPGLAVLRSSRWPTAARRRSATRSSTRSRPRSTASRAARRCTRRPSSRRSGCMYFTDEFKDWEREHGGAVRLAARHAIRRALRARRAGPAGRRELAGPRDALDRPRPALRRERVRRRADRRRRQHATSTRSAPGARSILGHAHPRILAAVADAAAHGTTFGAPTEGEVELAEEVARRMPVASRCCA